MTAAEFDQYADDYRAMHEANISASGETPEYFAEYKIRDLARLIEGEGGNKGTVELLDFGGGVGASLPFYQDYLPAARITCGDLSVKSLAVAKSHGTAKTDFVALDGASLPFPDRTFDYVFVACVFHHIPAEHHLPVLHELHRVLKGRGMLMIYEHNPLNPLTVAAVNSCPFDANACLIRSTAMRDKLVAAGFGRSRIRYRVFFPKVLQRLRWLEDRLAWLPLGAQYFVVGTR